MCWVYSRGLREARMQAVALNKRCGYPLSRFRSDGLPPISFPDRCNCLEIGNVSACRDPILVLLVPCQRFSCPSANSIEMSTQSTDSVPTRTASIRPSSYYGRQTPHNQRWRSFVVPSDKANMSSQWADEPYSLISTHLFSQDVRRPIHYQS